MGRAVAKAVAAAQKDEDFGVRRRPCQRGWIRVSGARKKPESRRIDGGPVAVAEPYLTLCLPPSRSISWPTAKGCADGAPVWGQNSFSNMARSVVEAFRVSGRTYWPWLLGSHAVFVPLAGDPTSSLV